MRTGGHHHCSTMDFFHFSWTPTSELKKSPVALPQQVASHSSWRICLSSCQIPHCCWNWSLRYLFILKSNSSHQTLQNIKEKLQWCMEVQVRSMPWSYLHLNTCGSSPFNKNLGSHLKIHTKKIFPYPTNVWFERCILKNRFKAKTACTCHLQTLSCSFKGGQRLAFILNHTGLLQQPGFQTSVNSKACGQSRVLHPLPSADAMHDFSWAVHPVVLFPWALQNLRHMQNL